MTKSEIIAKIKKCLALSKSSNEHEAAAAMRQAMALMAKHNIEDAEILAADAGECGAKSGAKKSPSNWETRLANMVGNAFGCDVILFSTYFLASGEWRFIGVGASPEIAVYAFQVLHRQAKSARAEYIKTKLKRCKTSTKTARSDIFCEAWVSGIQRLLQTFSRTEQQSAAIAAYMSNKYPDLRNITPRDRNEGKNSAALDAAYWAGRNAAKNANLNHGVSGTDSPLALGK